MQVTLFDSPAVKPFKSQLLKWIGNKQRFAHEIASYFPADMNRYFEPFVGSGAVLATLAPSKAVASDVFEPLVEIWQTLSKAPNLLKSWYFDRWTEMQGGEKVERYEQIKARYNASPNGADLLFLCRSCYGGVVRFRKADGYMSTPCGVHAPISPESFSSRVDEWSNRTKGTEFRRLDFRDALDSASKGDLVYCDPPYTHSQAILYGAQSFNLSELFERIDRCKSRGVRVVVSIDGTKKSGATECELPIPDGLFEQEAFVNCGRSMLRRFQMGGKTLESELVSDRLLLTYSPLR
jgi:DNA adenine methylase